MPTNVIEKLKNLVPVNKVYIGKYIRHLKCMPLRQKTIDTKAWWIYTYLSWSEFSDAKEISPGWLEDYFLELKLFSAGLSLTGRRSFSTIFG